MGSRYKEFEKLNKVIYSHWSKPTKANGLGFRSKEAFSRCAELSVLNSKKWFDKVELVTDEQGYKFLIDDLKMPFTSVKVELDKLNHISDQYWSIGKIYSCKIQKEPFMHQDFDVIWFKKPPDRILKAQAAFQNIELDPMYHAFYLPLMHNAKLEKLKLKKYCNLDLLRAYNCGIILFNDLSIINKWYNLSLDYIENSLKNDLYKPIFFEQFLIYNLCLYYNFKVETIAFDHIWGELAAEIGYTHLISNSKRKKHIEKLVEEKLKKTKQKK